MFSKRVIVPLCCSLALALSACFHGACQESEPPIRRPKDGPPTLPPPELTVKLRLFKKTYLLREPVWVEVSVANVGQHEGQFYFTTGDGLVIEDSKGTKYSSDIHVGREPVKIAPGETLRKEFDIFGFSLGVPHEESLKLFWYLPAEEYTIYYHLNQTVRSEAYRIDAKTPIDTFEVLSPEGDDSEALKLLLESYDLQLEKRDRESIEKLQELVQKHPESGYVPWAMLRAANTLEKWREVIRRFPESREAVAAVKSIALHFINKKDKQGYINAMSHLVEEYPNTDIAAEAQRRLSNMQERYFHKRHKPDAEEQEQGE
jgi:hypothetical protein